jgi:hypothetical protein
VSESSDQIVHTGRSRTVGRRYFHDYSHPWTAFVARWEFMWCALGRQIQRGTRRDLLARKRAA